jgi:hypothetical protein
MQTRNKTIHLKAYCIAFSIQRGHILDLYVIGFRGWAILLRSPVGEHS